MQILSLRFSNFLFITVTAFLLTACDPELPAVEKTSLVRPAKLLKIGSSVSDDYLNYPAIIKSQKLRTLAFEVGGVVKELPVIEAQKVKQGDVLAKLDQRDVLAKRDAAQAQFDNAESEYQRGVRLMKEDAISRSKLDQRKSQRDVTRSQLETAEKALQDSVLIAPFDGAIAKVSIKKLQVVKPGESAIDILGKAGFEAKINLPSSILAKSKNNAGATTDSYVILDAAPDRRIPAIFKEATLEADAASQTYQITFAFDAPEELVILPGMNASIWFKDPRGPVLGGNNISIPLTAIATGGDQKYVWVVDTDSMMVSKRTVIIESDVGTTIGVISGLEPGETIVAAGIAVLIEGMKVSAWSK